MKQKKIFFNAVVNHEGLTEAQKLFLNYVAGKGAGDDFTRKLDERVREIKMDNFHALIENQPMSTIVDVHTKNYKK